MMAQGDIAGVKAALAAGADPDARNPRNPLNPLIHAANQGDTELVGALLDGGADPNRRSLIDSGIRGVSLDKPTPLESAAFSESMQRLATVQRLLAAGANPGSSYIRLGACLRGDLALLDLAIGSGTPAGTDRKGNGCLHLAAYGGHAKMIERLLQDGAGDDPNLPNKAGRLPLDTALARDNYRAALALFKTGGRSTVPSRVQRILESDAKDPDMDPLRDWLQANPR